MRRVGGLIVPDEEWLGGYRRHTRMDDCTLYCPCGSTFTWSGYSEHLEPWMDAHRQHQKKEGKS